MKNLFITNENQEKSKVSTANKFGAVIAFGLLAFLLLIFILPSPNKNEGMNVTESAERTFQQIIEEDHMTSRYEQFNLANYIEAGMHDPDSYKFIDGNYKITSDSTYVCHIECSGLNLFGVRVTQTYFADCNRHGSLLSVTVE